MSRGWDRGGMRTNDASSNRLFCGEPGPGGGVSGAAGVSGLVAGPGGFKPNVFTGLGPNDGSLPTINMGILDFSLEAWWCFRYIGDSSAYDTRMVIGYTDTALPAAFTVSSGIEFYQNTLNYRVWYDAVAGGAARVGTGFLVAAPGWNYTAVNFDRTGNMTVYLNGMLVATVAIDAVNTGNHSFLPGVSPTNLWPQITNSDPAAMVGPIAHHAALLTAAQIQNSFRGKRVQLLATTQIYYDWRQIHGHTGWDYTTGDGGLYDHNISPFCWLVSLPVGAPTGAAGTVVIPDLSGNGNDWTLTTQASYGPAVAGIPVDYSALARIGFLADPFWSN